MALGLGIGIGIAPGGGGASGPPPTPFNGMIIDIDTTLGQGSGSSFDQIRLPFQPNSFNYNGNPTGLNLDIIVDWGDGTSDTYNTNPTVDYEVSHDYGVGNGGVYTIKIDSPSQSIQGWSLHGGTSQVDKYDGRKLTDLKQWGYFDFAGNVLSPSGANVSYQVGYNFAQADNMIISATDTPIISGNSLRAVFSSYQGPSGSTFEIANLNNWDVSNVITFNEMFNVANTPQFNATIGDVSNWNISNATDISFMFQGSDFVGDVSNWNTSNVTNMAGCFTRTPGNPDLSNWDISNVTGGGLQALFYFCTNFTGGAWLNNWVFNSGLTKLDNLFADTQFNLPLNNWQTGNIKSFYSLFRNTPFNQDISMWDISGTYNTTFDYGLLDMFNGASDFDQDLSVWDAQATTCIRRFMGTGQASDPEISPAKYDNMLVAFGARIPYTNAKNSSWCGAQVWEFGISKYNLSNSAAVAGRNALISDMGGIVDGGGI